MGRSHAHAYRRIGGCDIVGVVSRGSESRDRLSEELGGVRKFGSFKQALAATEPDAVCISTYPDTHAAYAIAAMEAGAHVFVEKPLGVTVAEAEKVARTARIRERKVVVGYILHHHPGWARFTELARTLGKPLVMRMNLNQQSTGHEWAVHRSLMESMSPIVDCGVHYVDIMCRMTGARPVRVQAIGARLTDEIAPEMYNYGQLQVVFDDGSVGWYEAGWGPMMSETAYFVKDVIGPGGSVSLVEAGSGGSSDIEGHTRADILHFHHAEAKDGEGSGGSDEFIEIDDEPDHDGLCEREQRFFLAAIREDRDLSDHLEAAVDSLRIVLAADQSIREGRAVDLVPSNVATAERVTGR
jgi:predicted dehydrogenase